ncbi:hypothetical protein SERLA73DRAFT_162720 [Serpula lacrymans var. lacrymans S7.3]|uniref:Uncharacterized protein n=2 Tax=Serpula lacrymans var. lacrymans TaxID=341189 RepID=F8Q9C8_SERL3|nr:uncharacterized protein SERLADRAFT_452767 [Serpula lacrymans var. lacrymans S7.9]EGN95183.1 hypothetical protein SERLA73DRAFT_162720 [Serpula lacrymans var. lacrymans S7.3]EGO20712.1 hypothetical protein SERLADRAFT_452767 [Serpula lacrymans var. lacrymans S7.9]
MAPALCDNCHKKPKFSTFQYCGKTCAAEATAKNTGAGRGGKAKGAPTPGKPNNLCIQCGKKPKFGTHNYCGKRCATLGAANAGPQPARQGRQVAPAKPKAPAVRTPAVPAPTKANLFASLKGKKAVEEGSESDFSSDYGDSDSAIDPDDYPSSDDPSTPATPSGRGATTKKIPPKPATKRNAPGTCVIPGCGKPSFVDNSGATSDYCSIKHREEAVTSGVVLACIMCKRFPQSDANHFCSKACRDQALVKP